MRASPGPGITDPHPAASFVAVLPLPGRHGPPGTPEPRLPVADRPKRPPRLVQSAPVGPVAQRLVQGTHQMVPSRGNARSGRDEFRGTFGREALMAILSRAAGTPAEGAETTWGLQCP